MRHLPEGLLSGLRIGLGRAVEECGANPRLFQRIDRAIRMFRGRIVVAPVDQRGCAAVDLVQRANQRGDENVLGREFGRETRMHVMEVFEDGPVAGHAAQRGLPGVLVRIYETRQHDASRCVNNFRMRRADSRRHLPDETVLDEHVAAGQVAHGRVHADDATAANKDCRHDYRGTRPSLTLTFSGLSSMPAALASSSSRTEKSTSS